MSDGIQVDNRSSRRNSLKFVGAGAVSFGPENIDAHLVAEIDKLLARPSGWLIYNTHGLDEEGWGPLSSSVLDRLLARLVAMPHVSILPAGRALSML
ncbi:MAG TPA: hypothetical protein VJ828_12665 [Lacipirellulaceae bacterium]|nr:hypothetical protein [Lacipirellulaceae bacterium]